MTENGTFKKAVRARAASTGEKYTEARRALLAERAAARRHSARQLPAERRPNLDELRALKMASKGRCPLVRAINVGEEAPITYESVDGWLPMPNAVRAAVQAGWATLDPPMRADGVVQHAVLTAEGGQVLNEATCPSCGLLMVDSQSRKEACLPPGPCWEATWSDGVMTNYKHIGGKTRSDLA
ncbi:hypothetical protein Q5424_04810 [Conexibacter sp. JD483]|uniref:hypothetical protein n=1 Tax=unclassified Conexibacter TaxID=2627773 RepID=UPI002725CFFC|nr:MULTISPECIES: hypothetical protein [unclassified Conexibacter]MDO8184653.1 hypothetical protein [Conexibacter sp. CPCC 205706]MDO8197959.1 hypothetical protein [Conexibacter sp. CPCC 205762]MDR9368389.1 hypothetical protein [Conexibacter sp. JD483]